MKLFLLGVLLQLLTVQAFPAAVIFSGSNVKALKQNLDLNGAVSVLSGSVDPSSSATSAPIGSLYLNTTTGVTYKKLDAGSSTNWVTFNPGGTFVQSQNLLKNSGWEADTSSWTASGGTYLRTTTAANVGRGIGAATWDSSSAAQTFTATAVVTPVGLYGHSGVVGCNIQGSAATHTLQAFDSTTSTILVSVSITSASNYTRTSANFTWPSTTDSVSLRLVSVASNEPLIAVDDCFMGDSEGFNTFTQQIASDWVDESALFTVNGFGAATDKIFTKRIGDTILVRGEFTSGTPAASTASISLPSKYVIDSTKQGTNSEEEGLMQREGASGISGVFANGIGFSLFYDGSTTNNIYMAQNSDVTNGVLIKTNGNNIASAASNVFSFHFSVPIVGFGNTGTVYRPDQVANSWAGYHDNTCSWARTNAAYGDPTADATCALVQRVNRNFGTVTTSGSVLPNIVFTPSRAGVYHVCSHFVIAGASLAAVVAARLWDGTTTIAETDFKEAVATDGTSVGLCGLYNATTTAAVTLSLQTKASAGAVTIAAAGGAASALEWEIFQVDQSFPAPLLVNSMTSELNGVTNTIYGLEDITSGSTCAWSQTSNSSVTCTRNAAGKFTLNIPAGSFSSVPVCTCTAQEPVGTNGGYCFVDTTSAPTTTAINFAIINESNALADFKAGIQCMGPH